jgi:hypothetical protein
MVRIFKICIILVMFLFLSVGTGTGLAGYVVNVDGTDDAGILGVDPYVQFNYSGGSQVVTTATAPTRWTSADDVYAYTFNHSVPNGWTLASSGNIWSTTDHIVGESLTGLSAGTYRITPIQATYLAFQRDAFNWTQNPDYYAKSWWEMQIQATNVYINGILEATHPFMLGSSTPYDTAEEAFNAAFGSYLDITLGEGGSLTFWIYDIDTIDNTGGLSVSVNAVPEPATILLLLLGVPFIIRKVRG